MTTVRIERSYDATYLCSHQGPQLTNHLYPDEAVITVHASEVDDEVAVAISAEATRICAAGAFHHPRSEIDDVPAYGIGGILVPAEELPDGKLVHIEIIDGELIVMLPMSRVAPELVERIATLGDGLSTIYYIR
jgi:hypothetical protein